jgi:hypothetical protein
LASYSVAIGASIGLDGDWCMAASALFVSVP